MNVVHIILPCLLNFVSSAMEMDLRSNFSVTVLGTLTCSICEARSPMGIQQGKCTKWTTIKVFGTVSIVKKNLIKGDEVIVDYGKTGSYNITGHSYVGYGKPNFHIKFETKCSNLSQCEGFDECKKKQNCKYAESAYIDENTYYRDDEKYQETEINFVENRKGHEVKYAC